MRTVVIPMAGKGTRLHDQGIKVLIPVDGKPMFITAILNLGFSFDDLILVSRVEHRIEEKFGCLPHLASRIKVVEINEDTEGPLCTVLKAREFIVPEQEVVIVNSDQILVWPGDWALTWFWRRGAVGGIPTIRDTSPRHSYVRAGETYGTITEVKEKEPISDRASIGVYWFRTGHQFLDAADAVIQANSRAPNGEFYVSAVYNMLDGLILEYPMCEFWSLGEYESLTAYLERNQ